ncbi:hypothetical protein [Xanthomonas graminis]|uniref:hypothetical protein n=1 Tax=Xanthomonas graminis TaxID=3390026 RepID=UPI001F3A28C3|nr:hypothetical protein [Xanthomonas translucens]UKE55116.1 hypothetical protein KFS84_04520 [Xanthomonas translucens pv. graminis]WIH09471.1 hypothetical protein KM579_05000 [Xanthomonas translucens pv. graminis]WIH12797.1 hypothetical protein KM563_02980 [Xanthomonas translucens pv. graminis]
MGGPKACDAGVLHQYARRTEMRELTVEETIAVAGGLEAGCSYTKTVTKNADGSTTTTKTVECHAKG